MPLYRISLFILTICVLFSLIHAQGVTTTSNASPSATTAAGTATATGSATNPTATGSNSATDSSNAGGSSTSINFRDPPGGVSMITPAATDASATFYKIGATVTLSWNYTSVQVTPSAIVVQAYCPTNKYYYPVASDLTFNETRVLWDTAAYEANTTQPLLTAMYTLYILDSSRHVTDIPQAGVLGNMLGFPFGMYEPQSYTPLPSTLPTSSAQLDFSSGRVDGSEYLCDL